MAISTEVSEISRIRAEYERREREIPQDFYAWNRPVNQFFHYQTAKACIAALVEEGKLVYGMACLVASCLTAARHGWSLLPVLPLVFATYHVSYGLGFLAGALYWSLNGRTSAQPGRRFTQVTR